MLGQDGQQMLIKNGSFYLRLHPCRLQLINNKPQSHHSVQSNPNPKQSTIQPIIQSDEQIYNSDSDSSDELN